MPRETTETKAARVKKIIDRLRKAYPETHSELDHTSPLELLVATILSAQCTDKRVNRVTAKMIKKYRTTSDQANARNSELDKERKATGFIRNKPKNIQSCTRT